MKKTSTKGNLSKCVWKQIYWSETKFYINRSTLAGVNVRNNHTGCWDVFFCMFIPIYWVRRSKINYKVLQFIGYKFWDDFDCVGICWPLLEIDRATHVEKRNKSKKNSTFSIRTHRFMTSSNALFHLNPPFFFDIWS